VPAVTYTDPEVARLGVTEAEARERYGDVSVYRYELHDLDRAIVDGQDTGFVQVVTRRNGRILGATIVARDAGELLPVLVFAQRRGVPFHKLSRQVWAYPTMAEGIKRAADLHYRRALTGFRGALMRRIVRWLA
jgi:pyruvate/2-oxoglutarate dehydrogenase complex dihydrolipoamide dehydrogenase (E3) component